ncbi:MAG: hypothetical protein LWW94_11150 [Candidatus Desulfofervidaceae bacterium]|nr:hypothetical protein [Candidatus Desulfofervidaceae bacterium]
MAGPLRIGFHEAVYHITSRRDKRDLRMTNKIHNSRPDPQLPGRLNHEQYEELSDFF